MPELPEVETTCNGIRPALLKQTIKQLIVRDARLRWPVPQDLPDKVCGQVIISVRRRAKYILIGLASGDLIWHLGMSGSMRIIAKAERDDIRLEKHDHIDLILENGVILRYNDPRRFGCLLWGGSEAAEHPLLSSLGPEPFDDGCTVEYLYQKSRGRKGAIKNFIMDQKIVVGVGNIYVSEALYLAGILPSKPAGKVSRVRYQALLEHIIKVLRSAIDQGGTTLKDFKNSDGKPGYFEQKLKVYGRLGEPCEQCGAKIKNKVIGQRASYYCAHCQQ